MTLPVVLLFNKINVIEFILFRGYRMNIKPIIITLVYTIPDALSTIRSYMFSRENMQFTV